jgi:hypothetical protein
MTNYLKSQIVLALHGLFSGTLVARYLFEGEYLFMTVPLILGVCVLAGMRYARRDIIDLVTNIERGVNNEKQ